MCTMQMEVSLVTDRREEEEEEGWFLLSLVDQRIGTLQPAQNRVSTVLRTQVHVVQ